MMPFDGNTTSIVIALVALLASTIAGIIWMAKYFAKTLSKDLQEHTKAAMQQVHASKEAVKASKEVLTFMKNLNGKLSKATIQTVQEQKVEHQHIENVIESHDNWTSPRLD